MSEFTPGGLLLVALSVAAMAGCPAEPVAHEPEHGGEAHAERGPAGHDDHEGHDHDGPSDLDRPVAELFAAQCEHGIKTHTCDECRYEVGVVKAEAGLFEGDLLQTARVERRTIAVPLRLTGEVSFDERRVAHVSTLVEGIIRRAYVTLGDKVEQGQALIEIESVAVGEAESAYLEAKGLLRLAEQNHERIAALRRERIASVKELLISRQALEAARIRADAALGGLTRLGVSARAARALTQAGAKGRLVLRAPLSGTVLSMHAVAGEVAHLEKSLLTVGDNASMWVWADIYERDIALVSDAQAAGPLAAAVEIKAFPGKEFDGQVDFISPSMSESSRTVKVRIVVPNPAGRLFNGMFAKVRIFIPADGQALTVPAEAVCEDEGRAFVFVHHHGDYYLRRPVTVGRTFAGLAEISQGLDGGETVIAKGSFLMKSDVLRSKMGAGCAD